MTKQDIEFIKTQIENIEFETPSMPLSEWEVWTSGAVTMYSAIMDMLYDLQNDLIEKVLAWRPLPEPWKEWEYHLWVKEHEDRIKEKEKYLFEESEKPL